MTSVLSIFICDRLKHQRNWENEG